MMEKALCTRRPRHGVPVGPASPQSGSLAWASCIRLLARRDATERQRSQQAEWEGQGSCLVDLNEAQADLKLSC